MVDAMRRFIHTTFGITVFLTICPYLPRSEPEVKVRELLDTVVGVVGAGNFSYWQLRHAGPLIVELASIKGDADLYISDTVRPSYEIDKNNFSSVTCGLDVVTIPTEFPRPVGIGIFGDWSHIVSEYNIKVYLDSIKVATEQHYSNLLRVQRSSDIEPTPKKEKSAKKVDEDRPRFLNLINILDTVFELFVF